MLRRRPSPALVIACLALFVSLSGVSYGLATGFIDSREIKNNTIATGDVRNNTLRTFDIRNNEIRGFDIRNSSVQGRDLAFNTIRGADIAEGSLGKVPNATHADSATRADGATRADSAANADAVSVLKTIPQFSLGTLDDPRPLVSHGSMTLTADCDREDPGSGTAARIKLQTTDGAVGGGTVDGVSVSPADGAVTIAELIAPFQGGTIWGDTTVYASSADKSITGQFAMSGLAIGAGAYYCGFYGHVVLAG